jgi:hypothetical protein
MLGLDEKAQPENDSSSFLGNAPVSDTKRQLAAAGTAATTTTGGQGLPDQYACVDETLYQMVRWLPPTSDTWFQSKDQLEGTETYGTANVNTEQWSTTFATLPFSKIMLQSGDGTQRVVFTKDAFKASASDDGYMSILTSTLDDQGSTTAPATAGTAGSMLKWETANGQFKLATQAQADQGTAGGDTT